MSEFDPFSFIISSPLIIHEVEIFTRTLKFNHEGDIVSNLNTSSKNSLINKWRRSSDIVNVLQFNISKKERARELPNNVPEMMIQLLVDILARSKNSFCDVLILLVPAKESRSKNKRLPLKVVDEILVKVACNAKRHALIWCGIFGTRYKPSVYYSQQPLPVLRMLF